MPSYHYYVVFWYALDESEPSYTLMVRTWSVEAQTALIDLLERYGDRPFAMPKPGDKDVLAVEGAIVPYGRVKSVEARTVHSDDCFVILKEWNPDADTEDEYDAGSEAMKLIV